MSIETIKRAVARLEELKAGTYELPWRAVGSGPASGDHWTVHEPSGEYLALIATQDGVNEAQREPTAELIAALSRTVDPLIDILRTEIRRIIQNGKVLEDQIHFNALDLARAVLGERDGE